MSFKKLKFKKLINTKMNVQTMMKIKIAEAYAVSIFSR